MVTLAIGIAGGTTVFSWIDTVLVRPIPGVANGHELLSFESLAPSGELHGEFLSRLPGPPRPPETAVRPRRGQTRSAEHRRRRPAPSASGANWYRATTLRVLGVRPAAGRMFSPEEYGDKPGGYPVAVIGYSLWKRRFSADPGVIGSTHPGQPAAAYRSSAWRRRSFAAACPDWPSKSGSRW